MAINVSENLKALDVDCDLITNDIRPVRDLSGAGDTFLAALVAGYI